MATINIAGSVFSALCFEHSHAMADSEGFLLGHLFKHVKSVISDSQISNTKEEAAIYINGYVPLNGVCNWYDSVGRIDQKKLRTLMQKENSQAVIGWYRSRRHSSMRPSLRDKKVHETLPYALQNIPPDKFIFGLFTTTETSNLSTHSFEHQFLQHDGKSFKPLQISVTNLGNTAHDEYREHPNMTLDPGASNYFTEAIESYRSDFYDSKSSTLKQVFTLVNLDSQLQSKLLDMSQEVAQSEAELEELKRVVENMELQCNQKAAALAPPPKEISVPILVDDDPFGKAPLNKGLNKKRLSSPKPGGSPAHQVSQKVTPARDPGTIHEDLLCLSMDTSPSQPKVETVPSDPKHTTPQPNPSLGSPQMSVRSAKQKSSSAELEAMDTNPILEPQQRTTTGDDVGTSKTTADNSEPFDFVADLLKSSTLPKTNSSKATKMKTSKSDDIVLSNGQAKSPEKTKHLEQKNLSTDVDMEVNSSQENQRLYTLSTSPDF